MTRGSGGASPPDVGPDVRRIEAMRVIEVDHKATIDLVARLITMQTATRGVIVPAAAALAGLGLTNDNAFLAWAAVPILVIAILADARNGEVQRRAHRRAAYLERIVQANLSMLSEHGTPVAGAAETQLNRSLDGYQFGMSRSLRAVRARTVLRGAVGQVSTWIYIGLIVIAVVAGLVAAASDPAPVEACVVTADGGVVRISGSDITLSGDVDLRPCPR